MVIALAVLAGRPETAIAQVKIKILENGSKLIYSETKTQRARRTSGRLLPVPSSEISRLISNHARRQGLAPRLVQALVQVESGYNPRARSSKGAMGLMQLMPATARELGVDQPYDPDQNIRGGTDYLHKMLRRFSGDLTLALAAYNAGPTAVERYQGIPPYRETRNYVRKVLSLYQNGVAPGAPPPLLQEHAREVTRRRQRAGEQTAEKKRRGEPVFITRDKSGKLVVSTSPKSN